MFQLPRQPGQERPSAIYEDKAAEGEQHVLIARELDGKVQPLLYHVRQQQYRCRNGKADPETFQEVARMMPCMLIMAAVLVVLLVRRLMLRVAVIVVRLRRRCMLLMCVMMAVMVFHG